MPKINERADAVRTREDLVAFLGALHANYVNRPGEWDNDDLDSFLEAMAAWAQDMDGYYANRGERVADVPPWRVVADMVMAARVYE